jgi:2-dehydro-3-deoxyphosphogluconate aldolase/(4S)-4-hydroxy-2-oxoglutarate aldolase
MEIGMERAQDILHRAPVIPVLAIDDLQEALPIAEALVAGGLPVLEVTLRTTAGLPAIRAIADALPEAIVGAGTVRNPEDFQRAVDAGSRFVISPGITDTLLEAARGAPVPLIPGVATVSELMTARDAGLSCLKFFPAEASGGAAALKAFAGPFPDMDFCPTGGVRLDNLADYLALPTVITVGGTWLTPRDAVAANDWAQLRRLAEEASAAVRALGRSV